MLVLLGWIPGTAKRAWSAPRAQLWRPRHTRTISLWSNAIPGTADRFTRSIAAASLPAFSRPPTTSSSYTIEMTWPRGSRRGSEKTPPSPFTCVSSPVSSRTSRTTASTVVSPNSTKPPGRAGSRRSGSLFRRTSTSFPPWRTIPSTATEGCACATVRSLPRGHPDPVLVCQANGVLVARVGVAHDTHSRVRRQDAHDPPFRVLGAVAHEQGPGVRRVSDPHTAAVVDGDQIRAGRRVQQRVEQRPVRDRIGAVPHPLRLAVRGRHRAGVQMIPGDDDGPAELARRHNAVDCLAEPRPLSVSEPTHPGREALPREVLLSEADPPGERLVVREFPQDDAVRLDDIVRVPRYRDPSERPAAFCEEGTDEERDESLKRERILDAGFLRLAPDVVPVVEHDAPGPEEVEHRPDVDRNRLSRATDVFLRILRAQGVRVWDGKPARDVSSERVVRARLVRHNIRPDLALHQFGMDLGTIPDQADRQRRPARLCFEGHLEGLVQLEDDPIAISVRHAPPNPGLVDLDVEAHAFVHLDRERLRASHAAHAARQDESAFQRAAEMFPRARRERLVRSLDDPLRSDVRPSAGRHLPVHREAQLLELVERLPVRPLRHEVGVRDQDPWSIAVRLEDRHRLAALHDEGLVVAEGLERLDDPVEGVPVPRGLAGAPVADEIVRLLRVFEIVLEHPEDGLLPPALAPQRRPARGFNALHPDSVIPSLRT